MASSDNNPVPSALFENNHWVSCLLLVAHRGSTPDAQNSRSTQSIDPCFCTTALPHLVRTDMAVYALVHHDVTYYDRVCKFLAKKEVTVLKEPIFDASFTDAIQSNLVEFFEVFVKFPGNTGKPTIAADFLNKAILSLVLNDDYTYSEEYLCYFADYTNIHPDPEDLLDEENINILNHLTRVGTKMRYRQTLGGTLLHFAAAKNSEALARVLLDSGADINAVTTHGRTAFHWAVERSLYREGSDEKVIAFIALLLKCGANVNGTVPYEGATATALHFAVKGKHLKLVQCLLEHGADINADSKAGNVLQVAVDKGKENTISLLLTHRPPDCTSAVDQKIFRNALKKCISTDVLQKFEECGFRISPRDAQDFDLLFKAGERGDIRRLNTLFKLGAGAKVHCRSNPLLRGGGTLSIVEDLLIHLLEREVIHFETIKFLLFLNGARSGKYYFMLFGPLRTNTGLLGIVCNIMNMRQSKQGFAEIAWKVNVLDLNVSGTFFLLHRKLFTSYLSRVGIPVEAIDCTPPERYITQVANMRKLKIGDSEISFHDFLNLPELKIVALLTNRKVTEELESGHYKELFPDFEAIIEWRFRKANYRRVLLDKAEVMLNYLFRDAPELPDMPRDKILDYLTNLDLLVFVNIGQLDDDSSVES